MNDIKFSITIPAYKSRFFKECIDSILDQTYKDFELIILNDCSPENVDEIVAQYNDQRIRYYKNEINVGSVNVVDNWNKLLSLAKGEYVICIGDDDILAPNCLDEYNILIDKYPDLNVYHARTLMIDENANFCDLQEDRPDYESVYSMIWHRTFKERIQFIGDFLYKVDKLKNNGGFFKLPLAWESDCVTSFIAAKDRGIANLHEPTFYYRRSHLSITNSSNVRLKMLATKQYEVWLDEFLKLIPEDEMDKRYYTLILKGAKEKITHNEIFMIANDLSSHYVNGFFYWMKKKSYYGLSISQFIISCIIGLGLKFKGYNL